MEWIPIQLQYRYKMVWRLFWSEDHIGLKIILVWRLFYSDDILMLDIQTVPIYISQLKKLRRMKILVFDSKYRIGFEIPTPASSSKGIFG